jgi:hypothetical protein
MQRREEVPSDAGARENAAFIDTQLERAVDALKGVMIYAEKASAKKEKTKTASAN